MKGSYLYLRTGFIKFFQKALTLFCGDERSLVRIYHNRDDHLVENFKALFYYFRMSLGGRVESACKDAFFHNDTLKKVR